MVQNGSMRGGKKWKYEIKNYRFTPEKCGDVPTAPLQPSDLHTRRKPGTTFAMFSEQHPAEKMAALFVLITTQRHDCFAIRSAKNRRVSFWSLIHQADKRANGWWNSKVTDVFAKLGKDLLFFQPSNSIMLWLTRMPLSLLLLLPLPLSARCLVIYKGNDTSWVKVTLCQKFYPVIPARLNPSCSIPHSELNYKHSLRTPITSKILSCNVVNNTWKPEWRPMSFPWV